MNILLALWLFLTVGGSVLIVYALAVFVRDARLALRQSDTFERRYAVIPNVLHIAQRLAAQLPLALIGVLALLHPQNPTAQTTIWGVLSVISLFIPSAAMDAVTVYDLWQRAQYHARLKAELSASLSKN